MKAYQIGMGVELDADGEVITHEERQQSLTLIRREAAARFGGFTITSTNGGWYDADRDAFVEEAGITLTIATDESKVTVELFADFARMMLRQASVVLTVLGESQFIEKRPAASPDRGIYDGHG